MLIQYLLFLGASLILLAFVLLWFLKNEFLVKRQKLVLVIEMVVLVISLGYVIYYIYQHLAA
jgi:hypothetical protein